MTTRGVWAFIPHGRHNVECVFGPRGGRLVENDKKEGIIVLNCRTFDGKLVASLTINSGFQTGGC